MAQKLYGSAEEVEEIAGKIIPTYHSELATAKIEYVFVDRASQKNGQPVLGKARRLTGEMEFLLGKDFLITVALDQWNEAGMSQREALVDHLLELCTGVEDEDTGEMRWSMRTPDIQEFTSVLHRHGAWNDRLVGMVEVAQRLNIQARVQEVTDAEVRQSED